jgi:hypothetical protein
MANQGNPVPGPSRTLLAAQLLLLDIVALEISVHKVIHVKALMMVCITLLSLSSWYAILYDPLRVSAFMLMGLAMSAVSVAVYYRRI